jgi:hypothetical protein
MIGSRSASSLLLGALRATVGLDTGFVGATTTSVALSLLTSGFRVDFFATGAGGVSVAGFGAAVLVVLVDGAAVVGVLVLEDARVATFGLVDMVVRSEGKARRVVERSRETCLLLSTIYSISIHS